MKKHSVSTLSLIFLMVSAELVAQTDTLKFMTYNLENFGAPGISCTPLDTATRKGYLQTIFDFVQPDFLGVCEINNNDAVVNYVLKNVINRNGRDYGRVNLSSETGDIVNMQFYNTKKFGLKSQDNITSTTRHVKVTQLYYKDPNFPLTTDTTFVFFLQAHLKASNTTADANTRKTESLNITNYLSSFGFAGNFILMGDLNLYTNAEAAYTNLTGNFNNSIRFYDPANRSGVWSQNSSFADVHTQCPGTSTANCLAGGGLDDRFDFILATSIVVSTTSSNNLKYIPGSYQVIGNDGLHYNQSITAGVTNTSAPSNVLTALRINSDHLPVVAKFSVKQSLPTLFGNNEGNGSFGTVSIKNNGETYSIRFNSARNIENMDVVVFDLLGVVSFQSQLDVVIGENSWEFPAGVFNAGLNIVSANLDRNHFQFKVVK